MVVRHFIAWRRNCCAHTIRSSTWCRRLVVRHYIAWRRNSRAHAIRSSIWCRRFVQVTTHRWKTLPERVLEAYVHFSVWNRVVFYSVLPEEAITVHRRLRTTTTDHSTAVTEALLIVVLIPRPGKDTICIVFFPNAVVVIARVGVVPNADLAVGCAVSFDYLVLDTHACIEVPAPRSLSRRPPDCLLVCATRAVARALQPDLYVS